ncbi:MAG TPA: aspartate kinase [Candidatus Limnocylindrales bacterium]|nr:aspartate kinase [Candidatus Limnocylindrales bacterium]
MQVLKFGGSSLADAAAIVHVARLVRELAADEQTVVVCSACAGVTNRLVHLTELARNGVSAHEVHEAWAIRARHRALLAALELSAAEKGVARGDATTECPEDQEIWSDLENLGTCFRSLALETRTEDKDASWVDAVLSYGECASARLVACALRWEGVPAEAVDASRFIVTDEQFQNATPIWEETRLRARDILLPLLEKGVVPVVTGFIGATADGEVTTLGRNSSDFSAAIVADALDADEVCLWTDVDGIYDRDPRSTDKKHSGEFTLLTELSYDEALDLAERGAKVLHPRTIEPLRKKNIALRIRNTFRPEHPGTRIGPAPGNEVRSELRRAAR